MLERIIVEESNSHCEALNQLIYIDFLLRIILNQYVYCKLTSNL
jgi:hypothetical protein